MNRVRHFTASLLAPIGALAVPFVLAVSPYYEEATAGSQALAEGAPTRAAGSFLLLGVPSAYLIGALFYSGVGHALARLNRLSLRATVLSAAFAPWALVLFGLVGLITYNKNWGGGLLTLAVLGLFASLFAALGALVWWLVAVRHSSREA